MVISESPQKKEVLKGISINSYNNMSIMRINISNMNFSDAIEVIKDSISTISSFNDQSIYTILVMENTRYNSELQQTIVDAAKKNSKKVVATAVVGLSSITKLMAKAAIKISGRKADFFDNIESGEKWLYEVFLSTK